MTLGPAWSYAQARLQSRHGERLQEAGWRALEAAQTLDRFIERSRVTSLRRFTEALSAGMSSHLIERVLRTGWRAYVGEVASWAPTEWQAAIQWTAPLPDLPTIDALLRGEAPAWAARDPVLLPFLQGERAALAKSPLAALLPDPERAPRLVARWHLYWRALWPKASAGERRALNQLTEAIEAHVEQLRRAGPHDASASYRGALAQSVTRMFRRNAASPAAAFCHLVLVALDLERLRGGLIRRALFPPSGTQEAA